MAFDKTKIRQKVQASILLDERRKEKILKSLDFLSDVELQELHEVLEAEEGHMKEIFETVLKERGDQAKEELDGAFRQVKRDFVKKAENEDLRVSRQEAKNTLSQLDNE